MVLNNDGHLHTLQPTYIQNGFTSNASKLLTGVTYTGVTVDG